MGPNTPWTDRLVGHGVLLVAELLAVPVSILATALVVLGGVLALNLLDVVGVLVTVVSRVLYNLLGVSIPVFPVWNDLVSGAVVLATVLALGSFGGVAVTLYRTAFEQIGDCHPGTAVLVPLLGLTPAAYVVASTGPAALPWWVFVFTAVWAHTLMYRTIAIDASLGGNPRVGLVVGCVVAVPAIVSEALFVAWHTGHREVVHRMVAVASVSGLPLTRSFLVLVPIGVTVAYGLRWALRCGAVPQRLPRLDRVSRPWSDVDSQPETGPSTDWIPRSPASVDGGEDIATSEPDRTLETGQQTGHSDPTHTPPQSTSIDGTKRTDQRATDTSDAAERRGSTTGGVTTADGATTGGGPEDAASSTDAPAASGIDGADVTSTNPSDHTSPVEIASDTRIFTGDTDGTPAGVVACPECSEDLPVSDDVRFCSQCGAEL